MLSRRRAVAMMVTAGVALSMAGREGHAETALTILYFSAADCPNCGMWARFKRPDFVQSPEGRRVPIREVARDTLRRPLANGDLPADLKWVMGKVPIQTPAFLLVRGNEVLASAWGAPGFDKYIVPKIRATLGT